MTDADFYLVPLAFVLLVVGSYGAAAAVQHLRQSASADAGQLAGLAASIACALCGLAWLIRRAYHAGILLELAAALVILLAIAVSVIVIAAITRG